VVFRVVTLSGLVRGYIPSDQGLPISSEGASECRIRWLWRVSGKATERLHVELCTGGSRYTRGLRSYESPRIPKARKTGNVLQSPVLC
jgi:hypothetical protein